MNRPQALTPTLHNTIRTKLTLFSATSWLTIFIVITTIIGLATFHNYGVSWDEPGIYSFAKETVNAYAKFLQPVQYTDPKSSWDLKYYGPFYFIFTELLAKDIQSLGIQIPQPDLWHLIYFLTFQGGVVFFYLLCRRWLTDWAALGTTVLFASQPLLWGHAFINPKDMPFMVFFLASFYVGLVMVDHLTVNLPILAPKDGIVDLFRQGKREWQELPSASQRTAKIQAVFFIGLAFLILVGTPVWQNLLSGFIHSIYGNPSDSFFGNLFKSVALSAANVPVENYIHKISIWLIWLDRLAAIIFTGLASSMILRRTPITSKALGQLLITPLWEILISLRNPLILFSGILLGLTSSIRLLGPLAGFLIAILLVYRLRVRAWSPLLVYGGIALLSMFVTWPFLWASPVKHFLISLNIMSSFPTKAGILFAGHYYPANHLPWIYLPGLISIQFTEPAVILFFCSIGVLFLKHKRFIKSDLLLLGIGWILLPFLLLIIGQRTLYDNFRHILFLIPPLFILMGFTIEILFDYVRPVLFRLALIIVLGLFGWIAMFQSHPYEYAYYNRFIGGMAGASNRYYLDYWGTSFHEAADYLNATAPANTKIVFCGPPDTLQIYLRPDLSALLDCKETIQQDNYSIALILTRDNRDKHLFPKAPIVFTVQRAGAIFAVVKSLR
jgi:hypothetical protein